jgi:hypothetical protein
MAIVPCPPSTTIQHGLVTFAPATFKALFPAFATVADADLVLNFSLAQLQLDNTCCSRVKNAVTRETLLNLLVAHITQLRNGINGQPPAGIVGRVSDATEGSVSVSADMGELQLGEAYYAQTQFGIMYWTSTARFRTMVYIAPPFNCADYGGGPGPAGFDPGGGGCGC